MSPLCCRAMIVFGFLAFYQPQSSHAQTFLGAATEALGGAGRAAISPLDTHFLNPAGVAFTKDYSFGGAYQMARPQGEDPVSTTALAITDNSPDRVLAGGFGYVKKRSSFPSRTLLDEDFSVSLASRILPTLSVGIGGHRLVRSNSAGPSWAKNNMSLGVMVIPAPFLGLGFVAYDMLTDDDLDLVPVLAMGAHVIIMDIVRLRADISRQEKRNPDKQGVLNLGAEFNLGMGFLLRGGGWWDGLTHQSYWTGGMAWEGPRLNVAYAIRSNTVVAGDTTQTFQAWLAF